MLLKDKVAVITGATKGIGKAITYALGKEKVHLCLLSRNLIELQKLKDDLLKLFPDISVLIIETDVTKTKQVYHFFDVVLNKYQKIDILVNNVGIIIPGSIDKHPEEDFYSVINTNLKGSFLITKKLIPLMKEYNEGHIININSILGKVGLPYAGLYTASKFGVDGLMLSLSKEVADYNINITNLYAGAVDTTLWDNMSCDFDRKLMIQPETIANSCIFALKNNNSSVINEIMVMPHQGILN